MAAQIMAKGAEGNNRLDRESERFCLRKRMGIIARPKTEKRDFNRCVKIGWIGQEKLTLERSALGSWTGS
jgi:hypothetical protein